jgi:hypothetical protein
VHDLALMHGLFHNRAFVVLVAPAAACGACGRRVTLGYQSQSGDSLRASQTAALAILASVPPCAVSAADRTPLKFLL